jgi:hypothetical protein
MSFPNNPVNGATTITNNILYVYNSTLTAWVRSLGSLVPSSTVPFNVISPAPSVSTTTGALIVAGGAYVNSNIFIGLTGVYGSTGNIGTQTVGLVVNTTDAVQLPIGPTGARPKTPNLGTIRWNNSLNQLEISTSSVSWSSLTYPVPGTYTVTYLVIGGGGSGGANSSPSGGQAPGGGGSGGLVYGQLNLTSGITYTASIGQGGAGGVINSDGYAGGNTTFSGGPYTVLALGGGAGAGTNGAGLAGGSGGGGMGNGYGGGTATQITINNPGAIINTGTRGGNSVGLYSPGGGGGSGGPGNGSGLGGTGTLSTITGVSIYYAAGGGGSSPTTGWFNGGYNITPNLGYGGGGTWNGGFNGTGSSGVVIISYNSPSQLGSGGIVTSYFNAGTSSTWWVHQFNSTSTYVA